MLTPLITDSPTLKLLAKNRNSQQYNKSSFRNYIESQKEKEKEKEEQRSISVESGLDEVEKEEKLSFKSITGFGLRTIPGKKMVLGRLIKIPPFMKPIFLDLKI